MGQRRARFAFSAKPFSSRVTAEFSDSGIAKNQGRRFVGHQAADYSAGGSKSNPDVTGPTGPVACI
jgi:hypothetical protein